MSSTRALRTTPRTGGTAFATTAVDFLSASLMTATSTGVNAAAASVPGAQTFEHANAAAAEATAVMNSVWMSTLPPEDGAE